MPGHLPHTRDFDEVPEDWHARLHAACRAVAGTLDVSFDDVSREDEAWASRRGTTTQVRRVAEAAGLHVHEATLPRRWWTRTQWDFVGILEDSGLPVAVRRQGGRFVFTDPEQETDVTVSDETADRLESVGYFLHNVQLSDLSGPAVLSVASRRTGRVALQLGGAGGLLALLLAVAIWVLGQGAAHPEDGGRLALVAMSGVAAVGAGAGLLWSARHWATTLCQTVRWNLDAAFNARMIRLPLSFFWARDRATLARRSGRWGEGSRVLGTVAVTGGGSLAVAGAGVGALLLAGTTEVALAVGLGGVVCALGTALVASSRSANRRRTAERADALADRMRSLTRLRLSGATEAAARDWLDQTTATGWFDETPPTRPFLGTVGHALIGAVLVGLGAVAVGRPIGPSAQLTMGLWGALTGGAFAALGQAVAKGRRAWADLRAAQPFFEGTPVETRSPSSPPRPRTVTLDDVTVQSEQASTPVLDEVTWTVPAGAFVVVRGAGGSGTTTLLRTLLGLVPVDAGTVRHDDVALTEATAPALRSQTTYLRQDGDVGGDVARAVLGQRLRDTTAGAAWTALEQAGLKETVEALPMQLQTFVSSSTFSGGQRQRIRLAHAFAQDAPLLLLDAPFGAIDAGPMQTILSSLQALDATRIVVTRRDDVAACADTVYQLQGGNLTSERDA